MQREGGAPLMIGTVVPHYRVEEKPGGLAMCIGSNAVNAKRNATSKFPPEEISPELPAPIRFLPDKGKEGSICSIEGIF